MADETDVSSMQQQTTTAAATRAARSSVLRLRGLPFAATERDIEEFFKDFELKQVQICKRNGRSTGEAYVQLENESVAGKAMQEQNCKHMGRRYIEIFEASESDLSPGMEGRGYLGYVLRLRGLPYSAGREDVEKFFEGIEIRKGEEGVVFSCNASGRPTGEAYVEFVSEEAQLEAMKRHKDHMGSRYIELFKSTKDDLLQALEQNRFYQREAEKRRWMAANMPALPAGPSPMGPSPGLKLPRSAQYNSGVDDVTRMFEGFSLGPQQVQVTPRSARSGESGSGLAIGKFQSPQEAMGAQESQQYAGPHGMQHGQLNVTRIHPDVLMMQQQQQQQYLMQQQMLQQQQLVGAETQAQISDQQLSGSDANFGSSLKSWIPPPPPEDYFFLTTDNITGVNNEMYSETKLNNMTTIATECPVGMNGRINDINRDMWPLSIPSEFGFVTGTGDDESLNNKSFPSLKDNIWSWDIGGSGKSGTECRI